MYLQVFLPHDNPTEWIDEQLVHDDLNNMIDKIMVTNIYLSTYALIKFNEEYDLNEIMEAFDFKHKVNVLDKKKYNSMHSHIKRVAKYCEVF